MTNLIAFKSRGKYKGEPLYPHKHKDETFVASSSRFEVDYVHVENQEELEALVRSGLGARMSNPEIKQAASFISSDKIQFNSSSSPSTTTASPITAKSILEKLATEIELEIDSITKLRKEQAFLRAHLANGQIKAKCVLCGDEYPIEFLIAAHIKKRSECSNSEKLDFDNIAALMCKAGCDDLYEKGYVFAGREREQIVKSKAME